MNISLIGACDRERMKERRCGCVAALLLLLLLLPAAAASQCVDFRELRRRLASAPLAAKFACGGRWVLRVTHGVLFT